MNNSVSTMSGKIKIKIVLLGNQAVGKSSIIQKYVKDHFDETSNPTVGIDFLVKNVVHKAKTYRLQLWDTAGQQRFRSLIPNYLKDAKCALIIVDVTSRASLNSAQSWLSLYNDNKTVDGFAFLIGNKIDLEYRQVTQEQAMKKAEELGIPYYELSAKTGQNIQNLFLNLIDISQQHSVSAGNFQLNRPKNQAIKDMKSVREDEGQDEQEKTVKNQAHKKVQKQENSEQTKIVLKNEKIAGDGSKKKAQGGCC